MIAEQVQLTVKEAQLAWKLADRRLDQLIDGRAGFLLLETATAELVVLTEILAELGSR